MGTLRRRITNSAHARGSWRGREDPRGDLPGRPEGDEAEQQDAAVVEAPRNVESLVGRVIRDLISSQRRVATIGHASLE